MLSTAVLLSTCGWHADNRCICARRGQPGLGLTLPPPQRRATSVQALRRLAGRNQGRGGDAEDVRTR